ncbi:galectin-4-like [Ammospiza caudacuta]|uniref:galectin-4-like n=1 Tax=Ammospiza caudacuta TaxID=2857398 RepID=UPI002738243C|nr:galectin-4-like [Ammospiza caudacuta]
MAFVSPPGHQAYFNPALPYSAALPGGLRSGMAVSVQGVVKVQAERFHVNLAMSSLEEADIALHVNPQFGAGVSVFNSRRGGRWEEELSRDLPPLHRGRAFEMIISVTTEGYRIQVNGTFYQEFPHRMPLENVKALNVAGDLELLSVSVMGGVGTSPQGGQVNTSSPNSDLLVMAQPPIVYPPVPFIGTIPGGLIPKKTIIIKGFVPHDANRFEINLRVGPTGDIVLHVNPRMEEGNAVVRNSFRGDSWGREERDLFCNSPFLREHFFNLSIRCMNDRFKAFANGQPLFDFHHRVPVGPHVDVLEIKGDVVLSYVHF